MEETKVVNDRNESADGTQICYEIASCSSVVKAIIDDLKECSIKYPTEKGISFLDVKIRLLLDYLAGLTCIAWRKMSGKRIENDPAVETTVEIRTVFEKMKPIDQKLRPYINRLLDGIATGAVDPNDPMRFKPNPDNMIADDTGEEVDSEDEKEKPKSNVYVPPKITAMHFDGDETLQQRKQKALEKIQKRTLNSSVLYELKKQYDDEPEEINETPDIHRLRENKEMKERLRFEEEYMMRLPVPKKRKLDRSQVTTMSNLSSITKFEDISALEMDVSDVSLKKKKGSKKLSAKKGKRKSFRNRRH